MPDLETGKRLERDGKIKKDNDKLGNIMNFRVYYVLSKPVIYKSERRRITLINGSSNMEGLEGSFSYCGLCMETAPCDVGQPSGRPHFGLCTFWGGLIWVAEGENGLLQLANHYF